MKRYNGYKIIEDSSFVEHFNIQVERTLKERLFSFKWFVKYKTVHKVKPNTNICVVKDCLFMHPTTAQQLYKEIEKKGIKLWITNVKDVDIN